MGLSNLEAGDYLAIGNPIAPIDDRATLLIEFTVPEAVATSMKIGLPVKATLITRSGEPYAGQVQAVGTRIDPLTRTLALRAEIPNPDLKLIPGSTFSISMQLPGEDRPVVPALAIQWDRLGAFVWRLTDKNTVERVNVAILARDADRVNLDADLKAGRQDHRRRRQLPACGADGTASRRLLRQVSISALRGSRVEQKSETPAEPAAAEQAPDDGGWIGIFVRRPILALVLNLLVIIAGFAAYQGIEVRELPDVDRPVVTVRATYTGATPESIDSQVTAVIESAVLARAGRHLDLVELLLRLGAHHHRVLQQDQPRKRGNGRARRGGRHRQPAPQGHGGRAAGRQSRRRCHPGHAALGFRRQALRGRAHRPRTARHRGQARRRRRALRPPTPTACARAPSRCASTRPPSPPAASASPI